MFPETLIPAPLHERLHRECAIRGATVRYADQVVLREVDLTVGATERLAVLGDNGAGKSTLLHLLAGRVPLGAGERRVIVPGGVALAEQRPEFPPSATVAEAIDLLLADVRELEVQIHATADAVAAASTGDQPGLLDRLALLVDRFEARDGHRVDQRVQAALDQLGLAGLDLARPVGELSGGERARLALATTMSAEAELLLLDEPTNDLDDAGIAWLEGRLARHRGALVVVTHDRAFLDRFATAIVVVEDGGLRRYGDGYAGYLAARADERIRLLREHEAWRADLARHRALLAANAFRLDRIPRKAPKAGFGHGAFKPRGRDHGAMSRIRNAKERVARLEANPASRPPDPLRFNAGFQETDTRSALARGTTSLLRVDSVRLGDGGGPRLDVEALTIAPGERWLVSGPNGAGKTTLLRVLAGELGPDTGSVTRADELRTSWLRQDLATRTPGTVLAAFAAGIGLDPDDAADRLLGTGLLEERHLERAVSTLSVGQRRRLELAQVVSTPSELMLLDEPTNHLAPELVEQLEGALVGYAGAVVTVTHDRRWRHRATSTAAPGAARTIRVTADGRCLVPDQRTTS